jgi:hypothetical protein
VRIRSRRPDRRLWLNNDRNRNARFSCSAIALFPSAAKNFSRQFQILLIIVVVSFSVSPRRDVPGQRLEESRQVALFVEGCRALKWAVSQRQRVAPLKTTMKRMIFVLRLGLARIDLPCWTRRMTLSFFASSVIDIENREP